MYIFKQSQNKLVPIKELRIDLEKDLQEVTEKNLEAVLGLKFISSEFALHNLRIDTLAFDEETKSFIIIEFKRNRNFSVIDQGYAYLALMLNNKADFILEYNEKTGSNLKKNDIDWTQSRVLFLANSFTSYQMNAIDFKDLPIELWEVKKFAGEILIFNQLKAQGVKESIKVISKSKGMKEVAREVRSYTTEDHFKEGWRSSKEIFEELRDRILNLDNRLKESPKKNYIGYKFGNSVIVSLKIRKSKILLGLNRVKPIDLRDPDKRTRYKKNCFKYWHLHQSLFDVNSKDDVDYAMFLIKQVWEKFNK